MNTFEYDGPEDDNNNSTIDYDDVDNDCQCFGIEADEDGSCDWFYNMFK